KVKVYRTDKGQRVDLCELGKGGIAGEMSLLDGRTRSATVEVIEDVEATVITLDEFEKKSHQIPEWFMAIIKILCTRLRDTDRRVRASLDSDTVANIATLLSIMTNRKREDSLSGNDELDLKFAKNEIMEILSLPHDRVTSALKEIEEQQLVIVSNNRIQVPDRNSLELFSMYKRGEIAESTIEVGTPLSKEAMDVLRFLYETTKNSKLEKNGSVDLQLNTLGEKANMLFSSGDFLTELANMEVVTFDEKNLLENKAAVITVNVKKITSVLAAFLFKSIDKGNQ
ncbi:MAG: Crp/Fnr family transcriptional regulator, partial [Fibrobacteres bacterium]|nr:Crp/Fnr family transcriptional regulator [Fibrobacterota bacterium]